jgi:hypothetical protein
MSLSPPGQKVQVSWTKVMTAKRSVSLPSLVAGSRVQLAVIKTIATNSPNIVFIRISSFSVFTFVGTHNPGTHNPPAPTIHHN